MWQTKIQSLSDGRVQRFVISNDAKKLTYKEVLDLWQDNPKFRSYFIRLLADSPFTAYRWETPCITKATQGRDFEFVLLRCDSLVRAVDANAFGSYFRSDSEIVSFPNLGRNAVMVVPSPVGAQEDYGHLASFIRNAPESQVHQLWHHIAVAMEKRISNKPVWLSTAGMGVSWLHVRLDNRPKYYGYSPYRKVA